MITFPTAPRVTPGEPVSSAHLAGLAHAVNARLRSGLGDGAWRIAWYWLQAARQIRNSNGAYLFPSNAEFFEFYQHLDPTAGEWPLTGPGDPEGTNVSSVAGEFVFGSEARDLYSEALRLTDETVGGLYLETELRGLPGPPGSTCYQGATPIGHAWYVGRLQRGAYDATTGSLAAPAFKAAREHLRIVNSGRSPHGNAYGGFLPTPEFLGNCSDGTTDTEPTPNYEIKFSALRDGLADITYPGTCPDDPSHVAAVYYLPDRYLVLKWGGTVDVLLTRDYLEGPYTGGRRLRKTWGDHLKRVLNYYASQFRGTNAQRKNESGEYLPDAPDYAFDIQRFLTSQYRLAPARGTLFGTDQVSDTPGYRTFTRGPGRVNGGTVLAGSVTAEEGFCLAGFYVRLCLGNTAATVEMLAGTEVVGTATVDAATPEAVVWLDTPVPAGTVVTFRVANDVTILPGGGLTIESAELLAYQPELHDLYLTVRVGGARTDLLAGTDGDGLHEPQAREIGDAYFALGCLTTINRSGGLLERTEINSNAVLEALRRFSRHVRILRPQHLVGYAVEGGKSILWLDPLAYGVRSANALAGITNAIAANAPPGGFSNEWVIDFQFKPYAVPDSSPWKREAYGDFWAFSDRCLFYHPTFPIPPAQATNHFAFGSKIWAPAEAPTGYRYATFPAEGRILNSTATADFFPSCRIYEPPGEIERAESVVVDGRDLVKLTLKGRLHHHPSAPASIGRDVGTWNITSLRAEGYRTTENALREYLVNQTTGQNCVGATQPGNAAANSDAWTTYSNLHGACIPHILLVQLVPRSYQDTNTTPDASDSPLEHDPFPQIELYLRAMCEGYVDGRTSQDIGCTTGIDAVFDYSWSNVCFDAFGGRWVTTLGDAARPERPEGHGPLPSTYLYADTFNQLAAICDQLTRVRIMLPFEFEVRNLTGTASMVVADVVDADNGTTACAGVPAEGVFWKGTPPNATATTVFGSWGTATQAVGNVQSSFTASGSLFTCSGSNWSLTTTRSTDEYRYALIDPDAEDALPPTIRDMLETNGQFLATVTTVLGRSGIEETNLAGADTCGGFAAWAQLDGDYLRFPDLSVTETTCQILPAYGRADAATLGPSVISGAPNGLGGTCNTGVQNEIAITPIVTDALILTIPLVPVDESGTLLA